MLTFKTTIIKDIESCGDKPSPVKKNIKETDLNNNNNNTYRTDTIISSLRHDKISNHVKINKQNETKRDY